MEKKFPPRVSIRKAEKGGVFLEYARGYRYGQKHPMPEHSITAEQEDLIDLFNRIPDGSTEYLSKEEFDAIVQPLVEALENECCCPGENNWITGEPIICDACTALNTYKKQTGKYNE